MTKTDRTAVWIASLSALGFWIVACFADSETAPLALMISGFHMIIAVAFSKIAKMK